MDFVCFRAVEIPERLQNAFAAMAGSGPAYIYQVKCRSVISIIRFDLIGFELPIRGVADPGFPHLTDNVITTSTLLVGCGKIHLWTLILPRLLVVSLRYVFWRPVGQGLIVINPLGGLGLPIWGGLQI